MSARKSLHFFVLTLCLWLPLQAIAGQWLHCAQIQSSLTHKNLTVFTKDTPAPCHQVVQDNPQSIDEQSTQSSDVKTCKHCQFMCHWHCVLVLGNMLSQNVELTPHFTPFKLPSPAQPLLALPQKPPQFLV